MKHRTFRDFIQTTLKYLYSYVENQIDRRQPPFQQNPKDTSQPSSLSFKVHVSDDNHKGTLINQ